MKNIPHFRSGLLLPTLKMMQYVIGQMENIWDEYNVRMYVVDIIFALYVLSYFFRTITRILNDKFGRSKILINLNNT